MCIIINPSIFGHWRFHNWLSYVQKSLDCISCVQCSPSLHHTFFLIVSVFIPSSIHSESPVFSSLAEVFLINNMLWSNQPAWKNEKSLPCQENGIHFKLLLRYFVGMLLLTGKSRFRPIKDSRRFSLWFGDDLDVDAYGKRMWWWRW